MCGIIGAVNRQRPIDERDLLRVQSILDRIAYRGPDGLGVWRDQRVILGHRRLSIIDLSSAGAQPFEDPAHGLYITFNGEIYNYQDIRAKLLAAGYQFKSHSDTEVLLYAYDYYGQDFLKQLRGMFAFCLYDQKRRRVLAARDSMGEKPFFYYLDRERFVFASELKTFHAYPDIPLDLDPESLKSFFVLQYIPGPHTVYSSIRELPPGSYLEIDLDSWQAAEKTFWSIEDQLVSPPAGPARIDELLAASVRYQLVADVKVGVLLSGGVDSSLISWHVKHCAGDVMAFTARFQRSELDEAPYAREVARALGIDLVFIDGGEVSQDIFDGVVFHGDEPIGDSACIPTYLLMKELSQHVTVVLSGEGADELFLGYDHYRREQVWQRLGPLTRALRGFPGASRLVNGLSERSQNILLARLNKLLFSRRDLGASRWTSVFADTALDSLLDLPAENPPGDCEYLVELERTLADLKGRVSPGYASLLADLRYWLPGDLLVKVDRMSMAHSVEARAPFLDPALVRGALQLPMADKMDRATGKRVLRNLFDAKFPDPSSKPLAWRPKHGFDTPLGDWLRGPLHAALEERLSDSALARTGLFNLAAVKEIKDQFKRSAGRTPALRRLWLLLVFQTWYEWHTRKFGFETVR